MKIKSHIFVFLFILLAFQIACGQIVNVSKHTVETQKNDVRIENAKDQINQMFISIFDNRNYEDLAKYAHSDAIRLLGGREKYNELMKNAYKLSFNNLEIISWKVEQHSNLIETNGELFIVFSRTLEGNSFQTPNIKQIGYLIGISNDNGDNWVFINGKHFINLYPNLLEKIKIPNEQTFINGVEQ